MSKYLVHDCDATTYSSFGDLQFGVLPVVWLSDVSGVPDPVARALAIVDAINSGIGSRSDSYPYPIRAVAVPGTPLFQIITIAANDAGLLSVEISPGNAQPLPAPRTSASFELPVTNGSRDVRNAIDGAALAAVAMLTGVNVTGLAVAT